jgi:tetratricopeptide (TPR) repeat protein
LFKSLLRYIVLAAFGTLLIGVVSPFWNSRQLQKGYQRAEALTTAGEHAEALAVLDRIEPLAGPFPQYAHRIDRLVVVCNARMADTVSALARAVDMYHHPLREPMQYVEKPFDAFEIPGLELLKLTVMKPDAEFKEDPWTGFHLFVTEAKRRDDKAMLAHAAKTMTELDPKSELAAGIKRYLGRSYSRLASRKPPKPVSNNARLARAYAAKKQWDRALAYANRALQEDPGNAEMVKLREQLQIQNARWGVVQSPKANCYNREGKFLKRALPPGTVVEVSETITAQSGTSLEVCMVHYGGKRLGGILLRTPDLLIMEGPLGLVSENERDLRVKYGKVLAAITKEKGELKKRAKQRNPYTTEYRVAREQYVAFAKRAEALTKQRDNSRGNDHMRVADQLRRMKGEGIRLRQRYEAALKKYQGWKQRNVRSIPTTSDRLEQLEAARDDVATQLAPFN